MPVLAAQQANVLNRSGQNRQCMFFPQWLGVLLRFIHQSIRRNDLHVPRLAQRQNAQHRFGF